MGVSILSTGTYAQSVLEIPDTIPGTDIIVTDSVRQGAQQLLTMYSQLRLKEEMKFDFDGTLSIARGILRSYLDRDFRNLPGTTAPSSSRIVDYVPAASPLAIAWILKAAGVQSVSKTPRMATATGISLAMSIGLTELLKNTAGEIRPDGSDSKSMSSGHAAIAFASATILAREYGDRSPWISVGAYTCATATQFLRFKHRAHWANDLFVGAGIGTVSANLGYFIADRIFGAKGINAPQMSRQALLRAMNFSEHPSGIQLISGSEFLDSDIRLDENRYITTSSVLSAGIDASFFFDSNWALQGMFRTSSAYGKLIDTTPYANSIPLMSQMDFYTFDLAAHYSFPVLMTSRIGARTFAGLRHATSFDDVLSSETRFQLGAGINVEAMSNKSHVVGVSVDYYHTFASYMHNRIAVNSYWKVMF